MFADDLIIMGQAQILEAQRMMEVMDIFCQIFGQKLNSHKSRVWFSKATDPNLKAHLQAFLKAPTAGPTELWVPLVADKPDHFQILIDKVHNRLQLWQAQFLSHAGKVLLIQSVIESIINYTMSTTDIAVSIRAQLKLAVRHFFWGRVDNRRYMALIGWDKITLPKILGGLGIRYIDNLNEAFIDKNLWKLLQNHNASWI
jgi:hypothetical protein